MTDLILHGTIHMDTKIDETFLQEFNEFLTSRNARFNGQIKVIDFDYAEIVDG